MEIGIQRSDVMYDILRRHIIWPTCRNYTENGDGAVVRESPRHGGLDVVDAHDEFCCARLEREFIVFGDGDRGCCNDKQGCIHSFAERILCQVVRLVSGRIGWLGRAIRQAEAHVEQRDRGDTENSQGREQRDKWVTSREHACRRCGSRLAVARFLIGERSTFFCAEHTHPDERDNSGIERDGNGDRNCNRRSAHRPHKTKEIDTREVQCREGDDHGEASERYGVSRCSVSERN
ncbi:unannotated protein [freshwater metagenome]|uniref:Unannotated protein n=1 Tax=freshwater metagenome TaxID=449393 RepID=A0A6J7CU21_9ZZZZ